MSGLPVVVIDAASARLLEATGWSAPEEGHPTGAQWIEHYRAPLATALGERVRYGSEVVGGLPPRPRPSGGRRPR
ncbi:hypothetical protein [Bogoriella caseilytica]|uniref:hypothetical protein n=1 Tax=Bogoriella caseilytica TaxID=56055 RepID=UPI001FEC2A4D|nr:hypothetical protein [Bogoriella caseilytica]